MSASEGSVCTECKKEGLIVPVPRSAPMGLCIQCFQKTTGLSDKDWEQEVLSAESQTPIPYEKLLKPGDVYGSGRYRLVDRLGYGGMGEVWLADDLQLEQRVSLKFLSPRIGRNANALKLLREEVRLCQRLSHPNIVRIHDWNEHSGEPVFIAMEYVDGGTLQDRLKAQKGGFFTWLSLAPFAEQLCLALQYAHERGVLHRDVKPRNFLLTRANDLKLADFGLARIASSSDAAPIGRTAGTLAYMSPQHRTGREPSFQDDLYAVGASLYELLTGAPPPCAAPNARITEQTWPKVPSINKVMEVRTPSRVPPCVEKAVLDCLSFDPDKRPTTAYEVSVMLGVHHPEVRGEKTKPSAPKWPRSLFWGLAILAGLCGLLLFKMWLEFSVSRRSGLTEVKFEPAVVTNADHGPVPIASNVSLSFILQPSPVEVRQGAPFTLRAKAEPEEQVTYQWSRNGQPIDGATASTLEAVAAMPSVSDYMLVASNTSGAVTSRLVQVKVRPAIPQKDVPWTNSLGMRFVPLPSRPLLVCISEVTVEDFRKMPLARSDKRANQPGVAPFQQAGDHPVVMVSWADATNFCRWLTECEREADRLGRGQTYRLPTKEEWSRMAGLGPESESELAGGQLNTRVDHAGLNLAGAEWRKVPAFANQPIMPGHEDPYVHTAPVLALGTNSLGLFHLLGNVSEWCQDDQGRRRVFRGASWQTSSPSKTSPTARGESDRTSVYVDVGFRVVIELTRNEAPRPL